jgi:orotate phosphoribosyltransferase
MEIAVFVLAVVASLVGTAALWVQVSSYLLQKSQGSGAPGQRLDPNEADRILDDVFEDPVRAIAAHHIFIESEKRGVGYIEKQDIGVYLDLHSASCDPAKREVLARSLAEFVQQMLGPQRLQGTSLASPREGNLIVGASTAQRLGLNFLVIRTGRAPRFGYPIEGGFSPGSSAILIDDLCMEASFLTRCVKLLRRYGVNVSHCICLFERLDGNAREGLAEVSVELHSKYQIDDDELARFKDYRTATLEAGEPQEGTELT